MHKLSSEDTPLSLFDEKHPSAQEDVSIPTSSQQTLKHAPTASDEHVLISSIHTMPIGSAAGLHGMRQYF